MKNLSIIEMYFDEKKGIQNIADIIGSTKQTIYNCIKKDPRYLEEANKRRENKNEKIKCRYSEIIELYYVQKKKVCDIAKKLGLNNASVTYVIKKDPRYDYEKKRRSLESKERNREMSKRIKTKKRKENDDFAVMNNLKLLQKQNSISMSKTRKMTSIGIVEANLNHYKFNEKKQRLEFDKSCGVRPIDLPSTIKVHTNQYFTGKTYEESEV